MGKESKINSRSKGATGEREFAKYLTERGLPARRGVQYQGGPDSPDIICESLPEYHFEVKRTERLHMYKAMDQADQDAGPDKVPMVVHRRNKGDWLVIMYADDLVDIIKDAEGLS